MLSTYSAVYNYSQYLSKELQERQDLIENLMSVLTVIISLTLWGYTRDTRYNTLKR